MRTERGQAKQATPSRSAKSPAQAATLHTRRGAPLPRRCDAPAGTCAILGGRHRWGLPVHGWPLFRRSVRKPLPLLVGVRDGTRLLFGSSRKK